MKIKKKYETIQCSNNHVFSIDYNGEIKKWNCVVLENEVVAYERSKETARMQITNTERAPHVIQLDTVVNIYGEDIPFQLENGFPFIELEGEWVPSDTFTEAKREAAIRMHKRSSRKEAITGCLMLLVLAAIWLINGSMGDWWMLSVFAIFFLSSAGMRMVRLRNELAAIQEAEAAAEAEEKEPQVDAIAAARALKAGNEEE